jgi:hypothetical protein
MPIEQTIHSLDRLIMGVASGVLTLADLAEFTQDLVQARLMHYRKLIDVSRSTPGFSKKELTALAQVLRSIHIDQPRGPIALVADPHRGEFALLFAALNIEGRPCKVFRNIHEARTWLSRCSIADD